MIYRVILRAEGQDYRVTQFRCHLELNRAGYLSAQLIHTAKLPEGAEITLDMQIGQSTGRLFWGHITQQELTAKRLIINADELAARLLQRLPLSLRHPTLIDVLQLAEIHSGLKFKFPQRDYITRRIPRYQHLGTGVQLIQALERAYQIEDFIWQQVGREIWLGSWRDSAHPQRAVTLPQQILSTWQRNGSAEIASLPLLRPGALVNGRRIEQVDFLGPKMRLTASVS